MVWSLDKNAWRDVRVNTITEWRVENDNLIKILTLFFRIFIC